MRTCSASQSREPLRRYHRHQPENTIGKIGFPCGYSVVRFAGVDPATGKYVHDLRPSDRRERTLRDDIGERHRTIQAGLRYTV